MTTQILAYSLLSTTLLLLAQGEAGQIEWGNLTALGIVAVVLIFIVTRMLPDLHAKFKAQSDVFIETVRDIQVVFSTTVKEIQADFTASTKEMQVTFVAAVDRMHERTDRQELQRHEDLVNLTKAVALLTTQCASHIGKLMITNTSSGEKQ
jgi:type III secretory pathway component EscR